jgi:hypothetical protein
MMAGNPTMKDCPNCRLINPDGAIRCDCGYDFPSGNVEHSYLAHRDKKLAGGAIGGIFAVYLLTRLILVGTSGKLDPQMKLVALLLLALITVVVLVWRGRSSRLR